MTSKTAMRILTAIVALIFLVSWITKSGSGMSDSTFTNVRDGFLITFAVFLTLSIFSFLYRDNPFYKFAESTLCRHLRRLLDVLWLLEHGRRQFRAARFAVAVGILPGSLSGARPITF